MTAPHFFTADVSGDRVVLVGDDARHAVKSLRIAPGETISVSNGAGEVVTATVVTAGARLEAEVVSRRTVPVPRPRLAVYQALAKHPKMDDVVARLAEAGATAIIPFTGHRSVARWDPDKAAAQHRRLNVIAREAAMQSRRAWLPRVATLERLDAIPEGSLVLHEEAATRLSAALPPEAPEEGVLVVGPEGGLTPEEIDVLAARGCVPVSLGDAVLRTETAALVAVALVLARYGVLG